MSVPNYLKPELSVELDNPNCMPVRAHESDAGADLIAKENTFLPQNIRCLVPTGVKVSIPVGYVGLLFPRSSLSKKYIVMTNSVGVIDSGYIGEIMASLMYIGDPNLNHDNAAFISQGERIVQLVIVPISLPTFKQVDSLDATKRGTGGFGSTGAI